jgi:hypothetical protein
VRIVWTICAGVAAWGCSTAEPTVVPNCGDIGLPAITVTLLDERNDQPIQAQALVIARDGTYADTARDAHLGFPTYALAYNRAGTYSVTVKATGYQPWQREPVVVLEDRCNVVTIPLAAHLVAQ